MIKLIQLVVAIYYQNKVVTIISRILEVIDSIDLVFFNGVKFEKVVIAPYFNYYCIINKIYKIIKRV